MIIEKRLNTCAERDTVRPKRDLTNMLARRLNSLVISSIARRAAAGGFPNDKFRETM